MKKKKLGRPPKKQRGRPKGSKNFKYRQIGTTVTIGSADAFKIGEGILGIIKALKG